MAKKLYEAQVHGTMVGAATGNSPEHAREGFISFLLSQIPLFGFYAMDTCTAFIINGKMIEVGELDEGVG